MGRWLLALLAACAFAASVPAAELPADIEWVTDTDEPLIGDPNALKGGTLNYFMDNYPLTFRLFGPNSNDSFANWNRRYTMSFGLVGRHPVTDAYIPWMATHWSVQSDNRTVYYKLDPAARWSDGEPVTADDYVFCYEMFGSPHIVDPFYNQYREQYWESVEAIDDHTLKIVGKNPSWRPLDDFGLFPMPRHAITLDDKWVEDYQNRPQVAAGPYIVTEQVTQERVVFTKVPNWWGEDKGYFKGLFNVDRIVLRVIPVERGLDYLKNGEIDFFGAMSAKEWAENTNFEQVQNGWIRKKRVFVDNPAGMSGLYMNLQAPLFRNKDFRKAMCYLLDFEKVNSNLMYNAYERINSVFQGTMFQNPLVKAYPFDPKTAREHLSRAGFSRRGPDGILVNDDGVRAAFALIYGSKTFERHMTVIQQAYRDAGVEIELKLLEGAAAFNRGLERKYEMINTGRVGGFYPGPRQYYHSSFVPETNNNNIWGFGRPDTDKLIETYMFDMDADRRQAAMWKLDEIIMDEAIYIPFWNAPYIRILHWDHVRYPEFYFPKRAQDLTEWDVWWIDPERKARLDAAVKAKRALPADAAVEVDFYGVREPEVKSAAPKLDWNSGLGVFDIATSDTVRMVSSASSTSGPAGLPVIAVLLLLGLGAVVGGGFITMARRK